MLDVIIDDTELNLQQKTYNYILGISILPCICICFNFMLLVVIL